MAIVDLNALNAAWDCGIRTLDSAQGYGQANQVIADYRSAGGHEFSVINKVMRHPAEAEDLMASLAHERDLMGIELFDCIMFHYAPSVMADFSDSFLDEVKAAGLARRVGLSIEIPAHYESLKNRFDFDVVQLPLNFVSQNFMTDEFLDELKNRGVEIHARSAFLQGLLLGNPSEIPAYLFPLAEKIKAYQGDCRALDVSFLTGCLLFLLQKPQVDHIVIGAQSAAQLREIADAYAGARTCKKTMNWQAYASDDFAMVHPLSWLEMSKKSEGNTT